MILVLMTPLPLPENYKPRKYPQFRTRINKANRKTLGDNLEKILRDPSTEPFPDIKVRGTQSRGYYNSEWCEEKGGIFIAIATEGERAGQITKAQPMSNDQLERLCEKRTIE